MALDNHDDDYDEYIAFVNRPMPVSKTYFRDLENPLELYNDEEFKERYRFKKETVINVIVPLIYQTDRTASNNRGLPIPPLLKVLIALRFYATSSFQIVCADLHKISQSTVCRIIKSVSENLCYHVAQIIKFPSTEKEINSVWNKFYKKSHFPGIIGVVGGTHIPIQNPGGQRGETFRNRNTFFSINVQIVGGPNEEIFNIVVRWPGSAEDSKVFENSAIRVRLEKTENLGHLLGDGGYPQRRYLFTPMLNPETPSQIRYNIAHKATRSIIEKTISTWKRRFPCLYFELQNKLKNTTRIITACAILHNIGLKEGDIWENGEDEGGQGIFNEVESIPLGNNTNVNNIREDFINMHFNLTQ